MSDYYKIQNLVIKKSDIVLIECSELSLKFILRGVEDYLFVDYEQYIDLKTDIDILDLDNYICIGELEVDDNIIVPTVYINKDYLSAVCFEEKELFSKTVITADILFSKGSYRKYPIVTKFKTIDEGVKAIG